VAAVAVAVVVDAVAKVRACRWAPGAKKVPRRRKASGCSTAKARLRPWTRPMATALRANAHPNRAPSRLRSRSAHRRLRRLRRQSRVPRWFGRPRPVPRTGPHAATATS